MAQNFIESTREQGFLLPPDVREWLAADHLAWFVIGATATLRRQGLCDSLDDAQERRVRLLLLGKGAVLADRPSARFAAEMDDEEQAAGRPGPARRDGSDAWKSAAGDACRYDDRSGVVVDIANAPL
jgi:hypothetical protein